jgi:hypothetical protein
MQQHNMQHHDMQQHDMPKMQQNMHKYFNAQQQQDNMHQQHNMSNIQRDNMHQQRNTHYNTQNNWNRSGNNNMSSNNGNMSHILNESNRSFINENILRNKMQQNITESPEYIKMMIKAKKQRMKFSEENPYYIKLNETVTI